jgi:hypothetical protein
MTIEQELIAVLSQIPSIVEKAQLDALVLRHPGHASQKPHGRRYGAGGEVLPKGHKRGDAVKGGKSGGGSAKKEEPKSNKPSGGDSQKQDANTDPSTWKQRLTKKEDRALRDYAGSEYQRLNSGLRNGKLSKKDQDTVDALDSALSKSRLTKDATLHSNETLFRAAEIPQVNAALKSGNIEGLEFSDKGFVSTSRDKDVAKNFQRSEGSRLYIINAPRGTKAGDISSLGSTFAKENETLLARDTKFRVSKVEKMKDRVSYYDSKGKVKYKDKMVEYIHLDIVGQG